MNETTDTTLMQRLQGGDETALAALIERHRTWLFGSALGMLGDEAAASDAVQETFIRLWLHRRRYDSRHAPATWLRAICTRRCYDELRRRQRHREALQEMPTSCDTDNLEADELRALLDSVVAQLPAKQQVVYRLRELEGLDSDGVCAATGMKPDQVKANLYTARNTVREKLKRYGIR